MYGMKILLVSVLVTFVHATNSSEFTNWQSSWIVGGTKAVAGRHPYMVSIRGATNNRFICGGTIIHPSYILTAAHCVYKKEPSFLVVVVGTQRRFGNTVGQKFRVLRYITHHAYNPATHKNDIALLKLRSRMAFRNTVAPIFLPNQDEETPPATTCLFMGWGITSPTAAAGAAYLRTIELKIISMLECMQSYLYVSVTYICADAGPEKGTGEGDAGGPLICNGKQVGVYSGGGTPGSRVSTPYASLFINVAKFSDWIQANAV